MHIDVIDRAFRSSALIAELEEIANTRDYSVFDSDAKRQHFVPRFLLSRFAQRVGDKELTFQLDIDTGENRSVDIRQAASRRYFYAILDDEGNRNNRIEGFLAFVETHAAEALRNFLADPLKPAPGDRATLSFFFALLDARTPVSTTRTAKTANTIMRLLMSAELTNKEKFATSYKTLFGDASTEDVERLREYMLESLADNRVDFSDPRANAISQAFGIAGRLAYVIYEMDWRLLLRDGAFVTSDRGLAMYDPALPEPFSAESWKSSPRAETTIPLSPDACLLIRPLSPGIDTQNVDDFGALVLNRRTFGWADGYVFGQDENVVAAVYQDALENPDKVVHPRPRSQVLIFDRDPEDTSFADENEARGWPRYLTHEGVEHDYVVFFHGDDSIELGREVNRRLEERARRELGIPEGQPVPGGAVIEPVDPAQLGGGGTLSANDVGA